MREIKQLVFIEYVFVIWYVILYYVLCALLFPDDLSDYNGYADYFYSRKKWFFAVLALLYGADIIDTIIKESMYLIVFTGNIRLEMRYMFYYAWWYKSR